MKKYVFVFLIAFLSSCATYYKRNIEFNQYFQQGNLDRASLALEKDKKADERKTRLLYFLNRGVVAFMQGNFAESNQFFEQAYNYTEDNQSNVVDQFASFLTNPNITDYKAEDHEALYINYYKALNYFDMGDYNAALVECKRMNIRLAAQADKYKNAKRFQHDAFIHVLMGIIYDTQHDYNNAFIAYRNAYEIYKNDYATLFNMAVPEQLKLDILRSAYLMGFSSDVTFYEKEFGMKYIHEKLDNSGDLVFLWHNGLSPVKAEWSINFAVNKGSGGQVIFANEEMGLNFPFAISNQDYESKGLGDLSFLRIAFPKYEERPLVYHKGIVSANGQSRQLGLVEDINEVAKKGLEDRMRLEVGKSLLRLAMKKAAEKMARSQNEGVGALVGMVNAITEKADTRNWQTLPHSIYYTRLKLPAGQQKVTLETKGQRSNTFTFDLNILKNQVLVKSFSTTDFVPTQYTSGY